MHHFKQNPIVLPYGRNRNSGVTSSVYVTKIKKNPDWIPMNFWNRSLQRAFRWPATFLKPHQTLRRKILSLSSQNY